MKTFDNYTNLLRNLFENLFRSAKDLAVVSKPEHFIFCIFCIINYLISLFLWFPTDFDNYTITLSLRIVSGILCLFLVFQEIWRGWITRYYALFWCFTLCYCLPFLSTFMFLMNEDSKFWMIGMSLSLFLLATLVNWQIYMATLFVGVFSALVLALSLKGFNDFYIHTFGNLAYILAFSVGVGVLFARKRQETEKAKVENLKNLSATIAHEMRTPLTTLSIASATFQTHMGELVSSYKKTKHLIEGKKHIDSRILEYLENAPGGLYRLSRRNLMLIDMLLKKVAGVNQEVTLAKCSMQTCLDRAIEEYVLDTDLRKHLFIDTFDDFIFLGDETLIIHVIFNLLSNSISQIQHHQKGFIRIHKSENQHFNIIHFWDNAGGIPDRVLPHIFMPFYSFGKSGGTGLGLAFCKEAMFKLGGDIRCHSKEEATEFSLYFPKP